MSLKFATNDIIKKSMSGFTDPNVWIKTAKMSIQTGCINLAQGFPDWGAAPMYIESLNKHLQNPNVNHQYNRAFGVPALANAIANDYSRYFKRNINPLSEVTITSGGSSALYNSFTSLLNRGDEVVVIEPYYECYLPQSIFSEALVKGVPLIPPKKRNEKKDYSNVSKDNLKVNFTDHWTFDFKKFESKLTEKTKLVILNSPNNPTGKIYSKEEYDEIAKIILKKSPNALILSDEVYEHIYYDDHKEFTRFANTNVNGQSMWDRTVSIYSAGKIFSITGVRIGWAVGSDQIIKCLNTLHQYNSFCGYEPLQLAVADCINGYGNRCEGSSDYLSWYRNKYNISRNHLIKALVDSSNFFESKEWKMNYWIPEGGYFVVGDISESDNKQEYVMDEDVGKKYSKDYSYIVNLNHKKKVGTIPLSVFYTQENKHIGENYIRFSFCKKLETIDAAKKNLVL